MRINGTLFVVFTLIAVFWGVKLLFGLFESAPESPGGGVTQTREDKIQALLSGEFKRQPKRNPVEGAGLLRCVVRDVQGEAVVGATVRVTPCDPTANPLEGEGEYRHYWDETTGASGLVEFRTLPTGNFLLLASLNGSHGLARVAVVDGGAFAEAQIALWPAEPRRGEVTAGGLPLADARVVPIAAEDFPGDDLAYRHLPVTTDADGAFEHPLLPAGAWQLLIAAPGYAPTLVRADEDGAYRAVLNTGEKLSGRVVRAEGGRPVNNVRVELSAKDIAGDRYAARTNGQGFFNFSALRTGNYKLCLGPGELRAEMELAITPENLKSEPAATPLTRNMKIDPLTGAAEATDASLSTTHESDVVVKVPPLLELRAEASASLRGRLLEAMAEVGAPGVDIALYRTDASIPPLKTKSDLAGYYQIKSIAPGTYRLEVDRMAGRVFVPQSSAEITVTVGGQMTGPVFSEVQPVTITGQVLDSDGGPISEAVVVVAIQGSVAPPLTFGADGEGRFVVSGVHGADKVEVWAQRLGLESAHFGPVTIGAPGLQDVVLRVSAP